MTNITWSENLSEEGGGEEEEDFPHIGQICFSNRSDKTKKYT